MDTGITVAPYQDTTDAVDQPPARPNRIDHIMDRLRWPGDKTEALTDLLHRAFARRSQLDIVCASSYQAAVQTRERIERSTSFLAIDHGRMISTILMHPFDHISDCPLYRDDETASLHQFAVDPMVSGPGGGRGFASFGRVPSQAGRFQLPCATHRKRATHLHTFYQHQGFHMVEALQFIGRQSRSVIMKKPLTEALHGGPVLA